MLRARITAGTTTRVIARATCTTAGPPPRATARFAERITTHAIARTAPRASARTTRRASTPAAEHADTRTTACIAPVRTTARARKTA
eukprot:6172969-Pleurochrysis_carterae.AAC.1